MTELKKSSSKKYYFQLILLCVGSLLMSYGLSELDTKFFSTIHFWIPTVFFAIITLITNYFLVGKIKEPKDFIFISLGINIGRLLLCMIVVFIYSLIYAQSQLAFSCHFVVQYVIFTIFELSFLLKHINTNP